MKTSRRQFVATTACALIGGAAVARAQSAAQPEVKPGEKPLIVSTWPFGKASNDAAWKILQNGGSLLDAVEQGIWVTELDASNKSVGLGGTPNAAGVSQLDACIMLGPGHKAGSVAGLEGIKHPISAARRVMEKTKHVMLVGEGARLFALEQGLESIETDSAAKHEAWKKKRAAEKAANPTGHDTLALLILGADGHIAGGCSTSGLGGKLPGRVGDSPIIGSGLYVDDEVGAAGATGLGENIMRYCGSFMVVENMRHGMTPTEACLETVRRIIKMEASANDLAINFVALDKHGRFGAAGSSPGFEYSVASTVGSRVLKCSEKA